MDERRKGRLGRPGSGYYTSMTMTACKLDDGDNFFEAFAITAAEQNLKSVDARQNRKVSDRCPFASAIHSQGRLEASQA